MHFSQQQNAKVKVSTVSRHVSHTDVSFAKLFRNIFPLMLLHIHHIEKSFKQRLWILVSFVFYFSNRTLGLYDEVAVFDKIDNVRFWFAFDRYEPKLNSLENC
jgi:hypothetical protein